MSLEEMYRALEQVKKRDEHTQQVLMDLAWMRFYSQLLRTAAGPFIPQ